MFKISNEAEQYIAELFVQQDEENLALKIDIVAAGTAAARVNFNFCNSMDLPKSYKKFTYKGFDTYADDNDLIYLKDSEVELKDEGSGKKLTINAPNAKGEKPKDDAPLEQRIKYTIAADISPQLASHGGFVELVKITDDFEVILNFGGGCQGCSSVKMTLKDGVETQLKALYPEIKAVVDVTDHSQTENAYM